MWKWVVYAAFKIYFDKNGGRDTPTVRAPFQYEKKMVHWFVIGYGLIKSTVKDVEWNRLKFDNIHKTKYSCRNFANEPFCMSKNEMGFSVIQIRIRAYSCDFANSI